ncbi:MAG: TauD/TfdA family dioxygenase [Pseudonocardiaceae bacterium]
MPIEPHFITYDSIAGNKLSSSTIRSHELVVIKEVPTVDNSCFLDIISRIGDIPELEDVPGAPIEDRFVYRIEAAQNPVAYGDGSVLASTTNEALPLHVDGVNRVNAYDFIALLIWKIDPSGPFTSFMTLDDVKSRLPATTLTELERPQWPFRYGQASILRENRKSIYYNPQLNERWSARYPIQRHEAQAALAELDSILTLDDAMEFPAEAGDCIIVTNTRVLHGRREIPADRQRVIKRIRFNQQRKKIRLP